MADRAHTTHLELRPRPHLDMVWAIRQLIETYYKPVLRDASLLDRLSVATHELLENAVKYGGDGPTSLLVEIVTSPQRLLHVEVRNPVAHEHVPALRDLLAEMARIGDPMTFYQARMVRAAKLKEGSGLGLARISFEAEMQLSMTVDDQHVSMAAVAPIVESEVSA